MKDHAGDYRGFTQVSRAWYGKHILNKAVKDEVTFGFYSPEGGTSGEMTMRWINLGSHVSPKLECFNDAFHALAQFKDVIDELADWDDADMTPAQFCKILLHYGFQDDTKEVNEDELKEGLRKQALAKLSDQERAVLGL